MAKLTVKTPEIVTLDYRQERGDPDYGTCMWATFRLDTERYEMMIMSDCGNYSYGWCPTPNSESFLHLMGRLDDGYLLDKLSSRTTVDREATFAAVKEYISEWCAEEDDDRLPDMDDVEVACQNYSEESIYSALLTVFDCTAMSNCDQYDLLCCIEKDYPSSAKKVVDVFMRYIKPKCREMDVGKIVLGGDRR